MAVSLLLVAEAAAGPAQPEDAREKAEKRELSFSFPRQTASFPGSSLRTSIFPIPNSSRFFKSPLARELLISLAISTPSP